MYPTRRCFHISSKNVHRLDSLEEKKRNAKLDLCMNSKDVSRFAPVYQIYLPPK